MKIPTYTSTSRITSETPSVTSNIQIDPRQNIGAALQPIGKAAEDYYIREKAIETKVKAGELNADATVEIFNAAEQAELKSTPQDGIDYFTQQYEIIKNKYKSQASNKNVANTFDIMLSQNKNVYVNNILKKTRDSLVTTRVGQVEQQVSSEILNAVSSGNKFQFDVLSKSALNKYKGLVEDGIISEENYNEYRKSFPALVETTMAKQAALKNAFGVLSSLDDNKNYPNIQGEARKKLRSELREIAVFQNKAVEFATNKLLLESKRKVADAFKGENNGYIGIDPSQLVNYSTGNQEYDNQINNLNNKFLDKKISLDTDYLVNDKIIKKILNNEIKNSFQTFMLPGETEAKSITERIGDGKINLDNDNFFSDVIEGQTDIKLNKSHKQFFEFIDKVVPLIEGSTSSKYFDENYNNRLSLFRQDMFTKFSKGLNDNIPVTKLLDSLSDNYIGKDLLDYTPTQSSVRNALLEYAEKQEFIPKENEPKRLKGESHTNWLTRWREWNKSN